MNGLGICSIIGLILYALLYNWELLKIFIIVYSIYLLLCLIFYPYFSKFNSIRKRIRATTWCEPYSPEMYSCLKIRFSKGLEFLSTVPKTEGRHVTVTHLVCKAVAEVLKRFPCLNGKLVFGHFVPYDTVDVSCLVAVDKGSDLGFACFRNADQKSLKEIALEASGKFESVRSGEERAKLKKASSPFTLIPNCVGGILIEFFAWLSVTLGLNLPFLGVNRHPCGPAIITNVGTFGTEIVFGPFPTILKLPMLVLISTIRDEVVVDNGELVIDKVLTITTTVDHRFIDDFQQAQAQSLLKEILENPSAFIKV